MHAFTWTVLYGKPSMYPVGSPTPKSTSEPGEEEVERLWLALCNECAATFDKSKVKHFVMVSKDDLRAALKAGRGA